MIGVLLWLLVWLAIGFGVALVVVKPLTKVIDDNTEVYDSPRVYAIVACALIILFGAVSALLMLLCGIIYAPLKVLLPRIDEVLVKEQ